MEKLILGIIAAVAVLFLIAVFSLFGGTVVWLAWPYAMEAFPRLVNEEWVVHKIGWWTAVCLSFVCNVLIKACQTNNNK